MACMLTLTILESWLDIALPIETVLIKCIRMLLGASWKLFLVVDYYREHQSEKGASILICANENDGNGCTYMSVGVLLPLSL